MKKFREFVQNQDVKSIVLNALDLDPNSDNSMTRLSVLDDAKNKILKDPAIRDIIAVSDNRGAILQALDGNNTTIGNLISLLT